MNRERRLGTIVSELLSRRGYGSVGADEQLTASIVTVVGSAIASDIQVGKLSRGVLQVLAADSTTMQELTFQKRKIVARLQQDHPQSKISDVRFRIASIQK